MLLVDFRGRPEGPYDPSYREMRMHIRAKMLTGDEITLSVKSTNTIREVKAKIDDQKRTLVDRVIFAGRQLEDGWTLAGEQSVAGCVEKLDRV